MRIFFSLLIFFICINNLYAAGASDDNELIEPLPTEIVSLIEKADYSSSIEKLKKFLEKNKNSADAWNYLGYSERKIGLYDDSMESYKRALKINKKHLGALEYQGELFILLGDLKNAKKNLKKIGKYCGLDCEEYLELQEVIENFN
tara:strand:+ start:551 stop:988 length:438 start_codon:yes stop_codon:yes gene_type:complete